MYHNGGVHVVGKCIVYLEKKLMTRKHVVDTESSDIKSTGIIMGVIKQSQPELL